LSWFFDFSGLDAGFPFVSEVGVASLKNNIENNMFAIAAAKNGRRYHGHSGRATIHSRRGPENGIAVSYATVNAVIWIVKPKGVPFRVEEPAIFV